MARNTSAMPPDPLPQPYHLANTNSICPNFTLSLLISVAVVSGGSTVYAAVSTLSYRFETGRTFYSVGRMIGKSGSDGEPPYVNPYVDIDDSSDPEDFFSPLLEESEPLLSGPVLNKNHTNYAAGTNPQTDNPHRLLRPWRPINRSVSDVAVAGRSRHRESTASSTQAAVHFQVQGDDDYDPAQDRLQASLRCLRPRLQRSSSSSRVELRSRYHNPDISSTSLQHQLVEQTRPTSICSGKTERVRQSLVKTRARYRVDAASDDAGPEPYSTARSNSDLRVPRPFTKPKRFGKTTPLKPCMKKKSKSATTTPPCEGPDAMTYIGRKPLRRVKTVDFDENGSLGLLAFVPMAVQSQKSVEVTTDQPAKSITQATRSKKAIHTAPSCPGIVSLAKSSLADPAVTRTDVHVIAIAPSWNIDEGGNGGDPATPTMQIVESKNGCYEVIWDDVPTEHSIRVKRRSSSASHALETISSTAIRGLERVNTKLEDWSGTWNSPPESFKPTIVVFPDGDGRARLYDCAVEDDDDFAVLAPPNSQRTSCAPSRLPSRPASAPMTRAGSEETINTKTALAESLPHGTSDWAFPTERSSVVPDPESRPGRHTNRRTKQPAGIRKLSNVEDADVRFRGHRDSVTIAHSRLIHSGGISPDLFAHRDSVSMARKRMHERNHALSAVRDIPSTKQDYKSRDDDDDGVSLVPLPTVKEHAAQALKNSTSASILRPPQESPDQRHIRIVE